MARFDPTDPAQLERLYEARASLLHQSDITGAVDGIGALDLPTRLNYVLIDRGLLTIASVQRRVADDTIGDVPSIGKGREKVLREALARWGREHSAERQD